jgi:hypothetical protein
MSIGAGLRASRPEETEADARRLPLSGSTHGRSYFDIVMVGIVGAILGLVAVIVLGSAFGSF